MVINQMTKYTGWIAQNENIQQPFQCKKSVLLYGENFRDRVKAFEAGLNLNISPDIVTKA